MVRLKENKERFLNYYHLSDWSKKPVSGCLNELQPYKLSIGKLNLRRNL